MHVLDLRWILLVLCCSTLRQLGRMIKRPFISWVSQRLWAFNSRCSLYIEAPPPRLIGTRCAARRTPAHAQHTHTCMCACMVQCMQAHTS